LLVAPLANLNLTYVLRVLGRTSLGFAVGRVAAEEKLGHPVREFPATGTDGAKDSLRHSAC
jgi:hypothetical protein